MYTRFPHLAPGTPARPTSDDIESGRWCYPGFEPDESGITILESGKPVSEQFANMSPEYVWLENEQQIIVAVSSPHIVNPRHGFYADLPKLFGHFADKTKNRSRLALHEGYPRALDVLRESDAHVVINHGDMGVAQKYAHESGIKPLSFDR